MRAGGVQHIVGKLLMRATTLLSTSFQSEVCTQSYMAPNLQESQLWEMGVLGQKCHLDVGLVERHRVYHKGEGGGSPQVWAVVSLVSPSLPMAHPNTKNAPTMH